MRQGQVKYTDGTPTRELEDVDEDWETSGLEEMNKLFENTKASKTTSSMKVEHKQNKSILDIRDSLNNLRDLVNVCASSLLAERTGLEENTQKNVAHVLLYYVDSIIVDLERELANQ